MNRGLDRKWPLHISTCCQWTLCWQNCRTALHSYFTKFDFSGGWSTCMNILGVGRECLRSDTQPFPQKQNFNQVTVNCFYWPSPRYCDRGNHRDKKNNSSVGTKYSDLDLPLIKEILILALVANPRLSCPQFSASKINFGHNVCQFSLCEWSFCSYMTSVVWNLHL